MEKEFVPYELAVKLKALGFDKPCFGLYAPPSKTVFLHHYGLLTAKEQVLAPLYQQAFRWFREKYDLVSWVRRRPGFVKEYSWYVSDFNDEDPDEYYFDIHIETYEEAELACLIKLLEIVESEKK